MIQHSPADGPLRRKSVEDKRNPYGKLVTLFA